MPIVSALLLSMSIGLFHSCGQPVSNPSIGQIPSTGINEEEEPFVQSLDIISMPKKTTYKEGEVFDPAGMLLKATWSHMDDETLLRKWKSNLDTFDRIALQKVLSERGYHFSNNRD